MVITILTCNKSDLLLVHKPVKTQMLPSPSFVSPVLFPICGMFLID